MAILYDARGNEFSGNLDMVNNGTITDARTATHTLSAANAEVVMDLNGHTSVHVDLRTAAGNLTVVFEGTVDGTNYVSLPGYNVLTEVQFTAIVVTTTQASVYTINCAGFRRVRARVSAYTSGNITVAMRGSTAQYMVHNKPIPSSILVTSTAAVNTQAVCTLPAAGAGIYHYITKIELVKLYNVVGVAAGAGNIITSTNLPGTPSWTVEQTADAAGTCKVVINWEMAGNPLKSSSAGNATTFTAPAQLQTIWRWNVAYYTGA